MQSQRNSSLEVQDRDFLLAESDDVYDLHEALKQFNNVSGLSLHLSQMILIYQHK